MTSPRTPVFNIILLLALAAFAVGMFLGLRGVDRIVAARNAVEHGYTVEKSATALLSSLKDLEVGQRGYLLSRDTSYLGPYLVAASEVPVQFRQLRALLDDLPGQTLALDSAEDLLRLKLQELRTSVSLGEAGKWGEAQEVVRAGSGRHYMDLLRARFARMLRSEGERIAFKQQQRLRALTELRIVLIGTGVLGSLLLLSAWFSARRHMHLREEAARAVDAQRTYLRTTLRSIGDGVITTDAHGRVDTLNKVAEELTGWTMQEAQGQPLETIFPIVNETTRATVENPALRALREGVVVGLANHTVLLRRDGTEVAIDDSAAPIRMEDGTVAGSVLIFRDIGVQRAAARRIEVSEARNRAMLATALDAIITIDHEGRIVEFNASAERIFGHARANVVGQELAALIIPPNFRDQHRRGMAHFLSTGEGPILDKRLELEALRADGELFPCELTVAKVQVHGDPLFTAFLRDITDRRKAENELRTLAADLSDANRRKAQFIATLAHELRNPLAPLSNAMELLKLDERRNEQRETLELMDRQVNMLVRLIDDLLDMSRIERGLIVLREEPLDLVQVVRQAVETSQPLIAAAGHHLQLDLPPHPVMVMGDLARLAQVFANLLNNSAKYTPKGGHVRMAMQVEPEWVQVDVQDNGMGIPQAMLRKVFDLFTQMDHTMAHAQGGLGIGLTLVKKLVALHEGKVEVTSPGVDQGATFSVRLPRRTAAPEGAAAGPKAAEAFTMRRILVVDDNPDSLFTLSLLLKRLGHEVSTAADGQEAVDAVNEQRPEMVLMDIGMPRLNGYEAAMQIRAMDDAAYRPVLIALTGWGQEQDRERAMQAGFDHHLVKPVELDALKRLISGI
ncbi:MAG: PAS domain S-box protein [Flavobacteriales bacterium]|nr:PAS domain S-box protein [Flavobacteriales bacterium]